MGHFYFKDGNTSYTIDLSSNFGSKYIGSDTYEAAQYWGAKNAYPGYKSTAYKDGNDVIYAIPHRTLDVYVNPGVTLNVSVPGVGSWSTTTYNIDVAANRTYNWSATCSAPYHFVGYQRGTTSISGTGDFITGSKAVNPSITIDTYAVTIINNTGFTVTLSGAMGDTIANGESATAYFNSGSTVGTIYASGNGYSGNKNIGSISSDLSYTMTSGTSHILARITKTFRPISAGNNTFTAMGSGSNSMGATITQYNNYLYWDASSYHCTIDIINEARDSCVILATQLISYAAITVDYVYSSGLNYNIYFN